MIIITKRMKCLLLIVMILMINANVEAKEYIRFNNLSIEDGLSQGTIEDMYQDSNGYLWFGSNNGLNKYNGYDFTIYRSELGNSNSLASDYIFDIKEDNSGNIWVATMAGISKIDSNDKICNYYINDLSSINVSSIIIRDNEDIIIGTSNGIYTYDKKREEFIKSSCNSKLTNVDINDLAEDNLGNIWAATREGLNKINLDNEEVIQYLSFNDNHLYSVYCDENDIWIGSFESGAYRLDTKTGVVENYSYSENDSNSIRGNVVRKFIKDSKNELWLATSRGISKFNKEANNFINYTNNNYDKNSLVNNQVYTILEDNTGNFWVGTYSGISNFNPYSSILHYKSNAFDNSTLSEDMIKGMYEDNQGNIWIGTNESGVDIFNNNFEKIENISNSTLSSNTINGINGYDNFILISTYSGLNILNTNSKERYLFNKTSGLSSDNVQQSLVDYDGNLWVATSNGVDIINSQGKVIKNLNDTFDQFNIKNKYTKVIFEDSRKNIWIGNFVDGGLLKIDKESGKVKNYRTDNSNLSNNTIRCIAEDVEGNLWIGTSNGINKYDYSTEKIEVYTSKDGLANNTVYGILIDDDNLWMSTNLGISKYDISKKNFTNYTVLDGLQSNEFNGFAYLKCKNGKLVFGGINGFNVIDSKALENSLLEPKLLIEQIKVNGVKVNTIQNRKLKYSENNIAIKFFSNDFKSKLNYKYYYISDKKGDEWQVLDSNSILFSNICPGKYNYRFKVQNSIGTFSDEVKISFIVKEVWWKSKLALFIYILIITLIIVKYRMKVNILNILVEQKTKKLTNEMKKNSELLNENIEIERKKNNYFVNLSHELRTPLNVIYSTQQLILELNKNGIKKEKLDNYMDIVGRNTKRLLKMINDIIDASKIENGNYHLNIKENDIVYLVEESVLTLKEYIEGKGVTLIVDPEMEEKVISCDYEAIERCIINLVGNAIKFTKAGDSITINIKEEHEKVIIEVIDTGIGIEEEYHESIFNRFNQIVDKNSERKGGSGLGLTITKQIIELHKGNIYVESKSGEGSKFIIILPANKNNT